MICLYFLAAPDGQVSPVEQPLLSMYAGLQKANLFAGSSEPRRALAVLDSIEMLSARVPSREVREPFLGDLWLARGTVLCASEPERALALLADALSLDERIGYRIRLPQVRLARADCFEHHGNLEATARELRLVTDAFLERRSQVPEGDLRASYLDSVHRAFERLASLELAARRAEAATPARRVVSARVLLDSLAAAVETAARRPWTGCYANAVPGSP